MEVQHAMDLSGAVCAPSAVLAFLRDGVLLVGKCERAEPQPPVV